MNPFDTLVLDEPPLAITPDALVARGRKQVRRTRLLAVAAGSGATCAAVAIAVPLTTETSGPSVRLAGTATPESLAHLPQLIRTLDADSGGRLITAADGEGHTQYYVTVDDRTDTERFRHPTTTIIRWDLPREPSRSACRPSYTECSSTDLPDGDELTVFHHVGDDGGDINTAVVTRASGTDLTIDSYDTWLPTGAAAPSGQPGYSLAELRTLAADLAHDLNHPLG